MQGTEKQIEWAVKIRKDKMLDIATQLNNMSKRLAGKPAAWWIDNRDVFAMDLLKQVAKEAA